MNYIQEWEAWWSETAYILGQKASFALHLLLELTRPRRRFHRRRWSR